MKMLIATVALAAVIASPAFAQSQNRPVRQQMQNQYDQSGQYTQTDGRRHSDNPSYDVYDGGQYVGSDPDPFIRGSLKHEYEANGDAGG